MSKSILDPMIDEVTRIAGTKMRAMSHEEVVALSMLLGDVSPLKCSCCRGNGWNSRLWGKRGCSQCKGLGYDLLGSKTLNAVLDQR